MRKSQASPTIIKWLLPKYDPQCSHKWNLENPWISFRNIVLFTIITVPFFTMCESVNTWTTNVSCECMDVWWKNHAVVCFSSPENMMWLLHSYRNQWSNHIILTTCTRWVYIVILHLKIASLISTIYWQHHLNVHVNPLENMQLKASLNSCVKSDTHFHYWTVK